MTKGYLSAWVDGTSTEDKVVLERITSKSSDDLTMTGEQKIFCEYFSLCRSWRIKEQRLLKKSKAKKEQRERTVETKPCSYAFW